MARVPEHVIEEIRERLFLPDVLADDGIELRQTGSSMRGLCPFESDTSNKSKFSVRDNHYKCFGCGKSGDVFSWLQERRGLNFVEALKEAAQKAGVDVEQYFQEQDEQRDPRQVARLELMGTLAEFSTKMAQQVQEPQLRDIDLTELIESGEVGALPKREAIKQKLDDLGIDRQPRRETGVSRYIDQLPGWMLWARSSSGVWGGRPVGQQQPVIGERGNRSKGWIQSELAGRKSRKADWFAITTDDYLYLALRKAGMENIFRALSPESLSWLKTLPIRSAEPILVTQPQKQSRKQAYQDGLQLLEEIPRLRVAEIELPNKQQLQHPQRIQNHINKQIQQAGTLFDWQCELMARFDVFQKPQGQKLAANKLFRIAQAVQAPVERAIYTNEIQRVTGIDPRERSSDRQEPKNSREPPPSRINK